MRAQYQSRVEAIRSGLKCSTAEGILATVHLSLTGGVFLTAYLVYLSMDDFLVSLIASLPAWLGFVRFFSPPLVRRLRARKPVATLFSAAERVSWLALVAVMFLDVPLWVKHYIVVATLLLKSVFGLIAANAWYSWMADLVPSTIRGAYYGRRNTYIGIISLVVAYLGGRFLGLLQSWQADKLGFTCLFVFAVATSIYAAIYLLRQHEPKLNNISSVSPKALLNFLKKNPLLRAYLGFFTLWQFSMGLSAAFFALYLMKTLGMTMGQMSNWVIIASLSAIAGNFLWGRLIDRLGPRCVSLGAGTMISLHVWIYMFTREGFIWPVYLANVFAGFLWSGFNIVHFVWPQKMCRPEDQVHADGLIGLISGPGFAVGSVAGGAIVTFLPDVVFQLGAYEFYKYQILFALSSIGRIIALILLARLSLSLSEEKRSIFRSVRDCLVGMGRLIGEHLNGAMKQFGRLRKACAALPRRTLAEDASK